LAGEIDVKEHCSFNFLVVILSSLVLGAPAFGALSEKSEAEVFAESLAKVKERPPTPKALESYALSPYEQSGADIAVACPDIRIDFVKAKAFDGEKSDSCSLAWVLLSKLGEHKDARNYIVKQAVSGVMKKRTHQ
jgi:hypothetical protein